MREMKLKSEFKLLGVRLLRLIPAVLALLMTAAPLHAETTADSSVVYPERRTDRNPVEYVLALPSIALQIPVKLVGTLVAGPVILVERHSYLPTIQEWLGELDVSGIRPVAGVQSKAGLLGGLSLVDKNLFSRGVGGRLKGTYSTTSYKFASLRLGGKQWGDGPFGLTVEGGWLEKTRERIYGLGPSSKSADEANYSYQGAFGDLTFRWQADPRLAVSVTGGMRRVDPSDGRRTSTEGDRNIIAERFAGQDLYGLLETLDLYSIGTELKLDWRDRPGSPLRGGTEVLRVAYVTANGPDNTDVGFWKVRGEAHHYFNLFGGRVIGLRVLAEITEPDEGTRVPFYELAHLGGSHSLRGFSTDRFAARDMAMFTVEYRWPLWRKIDAFLFTDQGRVFDNIEDDFAFTNFRSSYGGGLRIWSHDSNIELMTADSPEAIKFYLNLGAAF